MKRNQLIGAGISFGLAVGGAGWSKLSSRGDAAPNDEKRAADVETEAD